MALPSGIWLHSNVDAIYRDYILYHDYDYPYRDTIIAEIYGLSKLQRSKFVATSLFVSNGFCSIASSLSAGTTDFILHCILAYFLYVKCEI